MDTARSVGVVFGRAIPVASDEAVLVAELQAASEEAFNYLLAVYQNPVFNLITHIIEDEADAADVLQDVFVKIFKGIGRFRGHSSLRTWIYRIALHEASNHRRGWWRRRRREPVSLDEDRTGSEALRAESRIRAETPYQAMEQTERQELVRRALASLAQPYRTVLVLREMGGFSYEEIAQVLGVSEGTVKSRLTRGRELLKRKLAGELRRTDV